MLAEGSESVLQAFVSHCVPRNLHLEESFGSEIILAEGIFNYMIYVARCYNYRDDSSFTLQTCNRSNVRLLVSIISV